MAAPTKHGHATKRGMTRTYRIWLGMCARGAGTTSPERYAARGIDVCERWKSFEAFLADMGEAPPGLTLERVDNDKGYAPANCRWATKQEQANNRRSSRFIEHGGTRRTLAEWARTAGCSPETLANRIAKGWPFDSAITTPVSYANRRI